MINGTTEDGRLCREIINYIQNRSKWTHRTLTPSASAQTLWRDQIEQKEKESLKQNESEKTFCYRQICHSVHFMKFNVHSPHTVHYMTRLFFAYKYMCFYLHHCSVV